MYYTCCILIDVTQKSLVAIIFASVLLTIEVHGRKKETLLELNFQEETLISETLQNQ